VSIKGGEKVGIVGRTGAGKSTFAMALTRIVEICGGNILIDGVDISKTNMQQVRDAITIIPQDPVLFKGKMRFNLDPTNSCTDEEMVQLLEDAGLVELLLKKKAEERKLLGKGDGEGKGKKKGKGKRGGRGGKVEDGDDN
jgi:ABC-type bacteriocin/lantibiotic exporters, contain an N-terminal double-glycine peptidase domain